MNVRIINLRNYTLEEGEVLVRLDRYNKILGNKFVMHGESERDKVCNEYQAWFDEQIKDPDGDVRKELRKVFRVIQNNPKVAFGCWCHPLRCHTETILNFLKQYM